MVQRLLKQRGRWIIFRRSVVVGLVGVLLVPSVAAKKQKPVPERPWPELLLQDGRKLTYERTFTSQRDTRGKQGFWSKFFDVVAGEPDFRQLMRPYGIAVDSQDRIIITDPSLAGVHIFDLKQHKYKLIDRWENSKDPMIEPQGVAVDAKDNIYVSDSRAGKIFVFDAKGKMRKIFGSIKGGEGFFKRPTGIAVAQDGERVYVTDTLRDRVYILDSGGRVIRYFGQRGEGEGQFNLPTEVRVKGDTVAVVDAMNFRVQLFNRDGGFRGIIGKTGDPSGGIYRPKGLAFDSEEHIYLVESEWGLVQVYDQQGRLLCITEPLNEPHSGSLCEAVNP